MEDLELKMERLMKQHALEHEQMLIELAQSFIHEHMELLLNRFQYDYSGDLFFFEEMDRRVTIDVRNFKEDIAPEYSFIETFMAYPPLVAKLRELDLKEKTNDNFLFKLENLLDKKNYFTRVQLRKVLKKKYPEGIVCEIIDNWESCNHFYVVLPGDEDYEEEKNKLLGA
jgi:hypothetical protein